MKRTLLCVAMVLAMIVPMVLIPQPARATLTTTVWNTTHDWDAGTKQVDIGSYMVETTTDNPVLAPERYPDVPSENTLQSLNYWGDSFSRNVSDATNRLWEYPTLPTKCNVRENTTITRGTITLPGGNTYSTDEGAMIMTHNPINATVHTTTRSSVRGVGPEPDWDFTVKFQSLTEVSVNFSAMILPTLASAATECAGQLAPIASPAAGWWIYRNNVTTNWTIGAWTKTLAFGWKVCKIQSIGSRVDGFPFNLRIKVTGAAGIYTFYWNSLVFAYCNGDAMDRGFRNYDLKTGNLTIMLAAIEYDRVYGNGDRDTGTFLGGGYWESPAVGSALTTAQNLTVEARSWPTHDETNNRQQKLTLQLLNSTHAYLQNWTLSPLWPYPDVRTSHMNWSFVPNPATVQHGPYYVRVIFQPDNAGTGSPVLFSLAISAGPPASGPALGLGQMGNIMWLAFFAFVGCAVVAFVWSRRRSNA